MKHRWAFIKMVVSFKQYLGAVMVVIAVALQAQAQEKKEFNLLNPTPVELMREMSTDRPDKTESPYTVDAGHFQMETSIVDYMYDHKNPDEPLVRVDSFSLLPTNFKVGLLNNVDIQFVLNPFIRETTREDGIDQVKRGFGDFQTRLKINFWGNDEGKTAFAFMPFVKFPTNSDDLGNDAIEGGLIFPLAVELPAGWSMGLMAEFDFNENPSDGDYYTDYIHSITFGHAIVGDLNGYVEFFSNVSSQEDARWVSTANAGLTYAINKDVQLDMGINVGVTRAADDLNPFCGLTMRY